MVAVCASLILFGLILAYLFTHRNPNDSSLYILAGRGAKGSIGDRPVKVDVWVDEKLILRDVSGDRVPIISIRPGHHRVKITGMGCAPHVETVDAIPRGGEIYVYAEMDCVSVRK